MKSVLFTTKIVDYYVSVVFVRSKMTEQTFTIRNWRSCKMRRPPSPPPSPTPNGSKYDWILFANGLDEAIAARNVDAIYIYFFPLSFQKPLKMCSRNQDQCSFHGPGSGYYHDSHLNNSLTFVCKFAKKLMFEKCKHTVSNKRRNIVYKQIRS